jgi:hypothetical protein
MGSNKEIDPGPADDGQPKPDEKKRREVIAGMFQPISARPSEPSAHGSNCCCTDCVEKREPSAPKVEPENCPHRIGVGGYPEGQCPCFTRPTQATETASAPRSGNGEYCNCPGDFTDGLPYCQQCGLKSRAPSATGTQPAWIRQESCSECDGDGCAKCQTLKDRIAELLKLGSGDEDGPSEDAMFDYVKALHGAAQGTPQVEEIRCSICQSRNIDIRYNFSMSGKDSVECRNCKHEELHQHLPGAPAQSELSTSAAELIIAELKELDHCLDETPRKIPRLQSHFRYFTGAPAQPGPEEKR